MKKNTKIVLAIVALVAVIGVFLGIYLATRPGKNENLKTITVTVLHGDKTEKTYTIETEAATLAEAMNEQGLLGENFDGMYLTVDGETTDYNANGSWWNLLVNGEAALEGANTLAIVDGGAYRWEYTIGWA